MDSSTFVPVKEAFYLNDFVKLSPFDHLKDRMYFTELFITHDDFEKIGFRNKLFLETLLVGDIYVDILCMEIETFPHTQSNVDFFVEYLKALLDRRYISIFNRLNVSKVDLEKGLEYKGQIVIEPSQGKVNLYLEEGNKMPTSPKVSL